VPAFDRDRLLAAWNDLDAGTGRDAVPDSGR
jgi:hypothetical protein